MRHVRAVAAPARLGRVAIEAKLGLGDAGGPVRLIPALRVRHREAVTLLAVQFGVVATAAHRGTLLVHKPPMGSEEGGRMRHVYAVALRTHLTVCRSHCSRVTGACVAGQARDALPQMQRVRERLAVLKRKPCAEVGVTSGMVRFACRDEVTSCADSTVVVVSLPGASTAPPHEAVSRAMTPKAARSPKRRRGPAIRRIRATAPTAACRWHRRRPPRQSRP
jgi:hypothetical protein